jgi:hypothetical protein
MPAIPRSRLDEIRLLSVEVTAAIARGAGPEFIDRVARLAAGVAEVNAALVETEEMLLAGLRAEAVSMHDPELVTVARLLDLRSRSNWVAAYGWLLERGQRPPAPVNLEQAEQFAAAIDEADTLRDELASLRRLALERAPLGRRLELLRRLKAADPVSPVWFDAVATHEEARLRELRLAVPRARDAGDIDALAAMADELADPNWDQPPPIDLVQSTAGAVEAGALAAAVAEAKAIAAEIGRHRSQTAATVPREIDALATRRARLLELAEQADALSRSLADHPYFLEIVQSRGLDTAVPQTVAEAAASLQEIDRLATALKTRRDFESACNQLEHLCDHQPERGGETRWLADLQRCDAIARTACQELPELSLPVLLRERVHKAAVAVESRELLRGRFRVAAAAAAALGLLAITAVVGAILWQRNGYARTIDELERRIAEARAGLHVERPAFLDRVAGIHTGDPRVAALLEDFESGVAAEKDRIRAFKARIADHGERLEELAADVDKRASAGEDRWLEPWPATFVAATVALAEARRSGGLPDRRGQAAATIPPAAQGVRRFQDEENELASAEARQADLDRKLAQLAQRAFDARLARIQDRLAGDISAADAQVLLARLRDLREHAQTVKADGLAPGAAGQRVPQEAVATLDALETRLRQIAQDAKARTGESP